RHFWRNNSDPDQVSVWGPVGIERVEHPADRFARAVDPLTSMRRSPDSSATNIRALKGYVVMNTKLASLLAGVSLLALAGAAHAGQPLALSDHQMDGVTAGAAATADAAALALGDFLTFTTTQTATDAVTSIKG